MTRIIVDTTDTKTRITNAQSDAIFGAFGDDAVIENRYGRMRGMTVYIIKQKLADADLSGFVLSGDELKAIRGA